MSRTTLLTALLALVTAGGAPSLSAQASGQIQLPAILPGSSDSVDRAVVALLSRANQAEIAQVQQAAPTLKDAEVKKYAQMLIDDHTKAYSAVTAIGTKLGYPAAATPTPPTTPSNAPEESPKPPERPDVTPGSAVPAPTSAAQAASNDRQFVEGQITAHQQLIGQLPANDAAIQNKELRDHVGETRRVMQAHLAEARRLRDKVAAATP